MKNALWIMVVLLPMFAAFETLSTIRGIDFGDKVLTPRYPEITHAELIQLDKDALVKLSMSMLNEHKKMTEWWHSARSAQNVLSYVLLGLICLFAAILAVIMWRMPSNPVFEGGRAKGSAPPQHER